MYLGQGNSVSLWWLQTHDWPFPNIELGRLNGTEKRSDFTIEHEYHAFWSQWAIDKHEQAKNTGVRK